MPSLTRISKPSLTRIIDPITDFLSRGPQGRPPPASSGLRRPRRCLLTGGTAGAARTERRRPSRRSGTGHAPTVSIRVMSESLQLRVSSAASRVRAARLGAAAGAAKLAGERWTQRPRAGWVSSESLGPCRSRLSRSGLAGGNPAAAARGRRGAVPDCRPAVARPEGPRPASGCRPRPRLQQQAAPPPSGRGPPRSPTLLCSRATLRLPDHSRSIRVGPAGPFKSAWPVHPSQPADSIVQPAHPSQFSWSIRVRLAGPSESAQPVHPSHASRSIRVSSAGPSETGPPVHPSQASLSI